MGFKSDIPKVKRGVSVLIDQMRDGLEFKGKKTKTLLETQKEAFLRASKLTVDLYHFEDSETDGNPEVNWYIKTIEDIIEKGGVVIDNLFDGIASDITSDNESAIKSDMQAKSMAFDDVTTIKKKIDELSEILKASKDKEKITLLGNGSDFCSRWAKTNEKYPVGYIEELDAVSISYDGSRGEIIEIEGLRIMLPKAPPKTKIWKRSNKKEDQYFERQPMPKGLKEGNIKSYSSYINGQFQNRQHGFFFLNNGKPEYITGAHWMLLQWGKGGAEPSVIYPMGDYFYFTKAQQKLHFYLEACWVDDRSFGIAFSKIRRFGATAAGVNFFACKALTMLRSGFGMTSYNEEEAEKAFVRQKRIFRGYPFFFKPAHKILKKELTLFFDAGEDENEDENPTTLDRLAASEKAYDSRKLKGYFCDEAAKRQENIIEHWDIVKLTQTDGANIIGKTFMLTTIEQYNASENPRNDKNAGSGDRFLYIYDDSNPTVRFEDGRTGSGLYKLFISCYEHYAGYIDMYGYPIVENPRVPVKEVVNGEMRTIGIKKVMEIEMKKREKDLNSLYAFLRKTPRSEDDIKRVVSEDGLFNLVNINAQIEWNNKNDIGVVRGNFFWEEEYRKVKFYPSANGRFLMSCDIPIPNSVSEGLGGFLHPNNAGFLSLGVDPFRYEDTVDGRNSKGAIHGFSTYNQLGMPQHGFFLEYIERAGLDIFYEDVMKACIYFGCPALIERDVPELSRVMYGLGFQNFLAKHPIKKKKELTADENKYGGVSLKGGVSSVHTNTLGRYIDEHVGIAENDKHRAIGKIGYMPFNTTLSDWAKFNDKNRTDRDASISSGLAIMGVSKYTTREKPKRQLTGIVKSYKSF